MHPQDVVTQAGPDRATAEQSSDSLEHHELQGTVQETVGPYGERTDYVMSELADSYPSTFSDGGPGPGG